MRSMERELRWEPTEGTPSSSPTPEASGRSTGTAKKKEERGALGRSSKSAWITGPESASIGGGNDSLSAMGGEGKPLVEREKEAFSSLVGVPPTPSDMEENKKKTAERESMSLGRHRLEDEAGNEDLVPSDREELSKKRKRKGEGSTPDEEKDNPIRKPTTKRRFRKCRILSTDGEVSLPSEPRRLSQRKPMETDKI